MYAYNLSYPNGLATSALSMTLTIGAVYVQGIMKSGWHNEDSSMEEVAGRGDNPV